MKRLLVALMCLLLSIALCACGNVQAPISTQSVREAGGWKSYSKEDETAQVWMNTTELPLEIPYEGDSFTIKRIIALESLENYEYIPAFIVDFDISELSDSNKHWLFKQIGYSGMELSTFNASVLLDGGDNNIERYDRLDLVTYAFSGDRLLLLIGNSNKSYKYSLSDNTRVSLHIDFGVKSVAYSYIVSYNGEYDETAIKFANIKALDDEIYNYVVDANSILFSSDSTLEQDEAPEDSRLDSAVIVAKGYIDTSDFSRESLISQLEFSKFTNEEATYGADNCGADWNQEALDSAKNHIAHGDYSYEGLIKLLEYGKFTNEQAQYGADNCGADWQQEANDCAAGYLSHNSYSKSELISLLLYEGFSQSEAEMAADANIK